MNRPEEKDYFIPTSCVSEVIRVSEWYEMDSYKNPTKIVFWNVLMAFYDHMLVGRPTWRHQLRHIYHIIRTGSPWKDEVLLDMVHAKELRDKLDGLIKTAEGHLGETK